MDCHFYICPLAYDRTWPSFSMILFRLLRYFSPFPNIPRTFLHNLTQEPKYRKNMWCNLQSDLLFTFCLRLCITYRTPHNIHAKPTWSRISKQFVIPLGFFIRFYLNDKFYCFRARKVVLTVENAIFSIDTVKKCIKRL